MLTYECNIKAYNSKNEINRDQPYARIVHLFSGKIQEFSCRISYITKPLTHHSNYQSSKVKETSNEQNSFYSKACNGK